MPGRPWKAKLKHRRTGAVAVAFVLAAWISAEYLVVANELDKPGARLAGHLVLPLLGIGFLLGIVALFRDSKRSAAILSLLGAVALIVIINR